MKIGMNMYACLEKLRRAILGFTAFIFWDIGTGAATEIWRR